METSVKIKRLEQDFESLITRTSNILPELKSNLRKKRYRIEVTLSKLTISEELRLTETQVKGLRYQLTRLNREAANLQEKIEMMSNLVKFKIR